MRRFEKVLGKDFHETWAPVGHYTTLRCLLVICVQEGLETAHLDIKCAFQNGKLTDLGYVIQPEELGDGPGKVWRLRKALYGLKRAARELHKVLAELLHDLDFVTCLSDPDLYVRCIMFIWVDDLLIFTTPDVMVSMVYTIRCAAQPASSASSPAQPARLLSQPACIAPGLRSGLRWLKRSVGDPVGCGC